MLPEIPTDSKSGQSKYNSTQITAESKIAWQEDIKFCASLSNLHNVLQAVYDDQV